MPAVRSLIGLLGLPILSLAAQNPVERLGWMAGCWESREGGRSTLEMWLPPAGGLMLGASRTVSSGQVRSWEHLRLTADGDGVVYTALPSGQRETAFRATSLGDSSLVVENPTHDFPTRISYSRSGNDSLIARVEGPAPAGGMRGFGLGYARVACSGG